MRVGHIGLGLLLIFVLLESVLPAIPALYARTPDQVTSPAPSAIITALPPTDGLTVLVVDEDSPPVPGAIPGTGRETLVEWWNKSYDYRRRITVVEPDIVDRIMEPISAYLTFTGNTARKGIVVVTYWDQSIWHEVPSQIWNATTHNVGGYDYYNSCTLCFFANVTRNHEEVFYAYYDAKLSTSTPTYPNRIDAIPVDDTSVPNDRNGTSLASTMPSVTLTNGTVLSSRDVIRISTAYSTNSAVIVLTDTIRGDSDWGGPCLGLIAARYGAKNALRLATATALPYSGQYLAIGEFAFDPLGNDTSMNSDQLTRVNVGPDNPAEAWISGAGIWILDDGPLFTRIKVVTSDGAYTRIGAAYSPSGSRWSWARSSDTDVNSRDLSRGQDGGLGFLNYTIVYTFYYHGEDLLTNIQLDIEPNAQWANAKCNVKNYGDWPHVLALTCGSGAPTTIEAIQNRKAWYGTLRGLFNDSVETRRHDFPLEPWAAWYDNASGSDPTIGLIAKTNPVGWEVLSLVVGGMGDNLMLQQILREGHQGDFFVMPKGQHFVYDYTLFTSAYGTNYAETRSMAAKINTPCSASVSEVELYKHNVLTCYTKDVANAKMTDIDVYVYNSSSALVRSGTTAGVDADVLFDKLEDDAYTIVSNFTVASAYAGIVTFRVNTTQMTLNHTIQRGWTRTIACQLSKTTLHVVDWYDDTNLPTFAEIFLDNASTSDPIIALNASWPTGSVSSYLLPSLYSVNIRYLEQFRIHNQTTPMTVSGSSNTNVAIGVVAREHRSELLLKEPGTIPYVEVAYNTTTTFVVFYHDLDDDAGIDVTATSIPYVAYWTVSNSTHSNIASGPLTSVPGEQGNYTMTFDASLYLVNETYRLRMFVDANAPVDYWQAYVVVNIIIRGREVEIIPVSDSYSVFWNNTLTISVYLNDTATNNPILGATPQFFAVGLSGTLLPNGTAGWYSTTFRVNQLSVGTYTITIRARIAAYEDATRQILLYVAPQPTQSAIIDGHTSDQTGTIIRDLIPGNWWVPVGDLLILNFKFTGQWNQSIVGASARISYQVGYEQLVEIGNGVYRAIINTSTIPIGSYSAAVVFSSTNYDIAILSFSVDVRLIPSQIRLTYPTLNGTYLNLYVAEVFSVQVNFTDTWHQLPITGAALFADIPAIGRFNMPMANLGNGLYELLGLSTFLEGIYDLTIHGAAQNYVPGSLTVQLRVETNPVVRNGATIGMIAALIGLFILGGWFAYTRVFSIPWLVRKMRSMSQSLGKGKTPKLSGRDSRRIATRPDQVSSVLRAAYDGAEIPFAATAVPLAVTIAERDAEDKAIWAELDKLEDLGRDQRLELFDHMKRIPPQDRVWFLEDLKKQMTASARTGRATAAKKAPKPADDAQIMRRLDAIPTLSAEEKATLLKQIRGLPPDEREEVFKTLLEQAKEPKK